MRLYSLFILHETLQLNTWRLIEVADQLLLKTISSVNYQLNQHAGSVPRSWVQVPAGAVCSQCVCVGFPCHDYIGIFAYFYVI